METKQQLKKRAKEMVAYCIMKNADNKEKQRAKEQAIDVCIMTGNMLKDIKEKKEVQDEIIEDRIKYYDNLILEIKKI